jgi:predicted glutamine amidotransferase
VCKVFLIAGIKPKTAKNAWKFAEAMAKPMSQANDHGMGYAAITKDGNLFGERWLNNAEAFQPRVAPEDLDGKVFSTFGDAIDGTKKEPPQLGEYNSFGDIDKERAVAITLHARFATTPRGMMNTHPFVDEGVSLIHNGVIRNAERLNLNKISTCDSEAILRLYLDKNVKEDPNNFQAVADAMEGYYACGVLTNTETGPILDIFKGNNAFLHATFVKELDTYVLSTSEYDIKNTCKDLGFTHSEIYKINEGKFIRLNAVTHQNISITPFKVADNFTNYSNYSSRFPNHHTSTKTDAIGTGDTGVFDATKEGMPKVYPLNSRRNTEVPQHLMDYFNGKSTVYSLTERETQEIIAYQERLFGNL